MGLGGVCNNLSGECSSWHIVVENVVPSGIAVFGGTVEPLQGVAQQEEVAKDICLSGYSLVYIYLKPISPCLLRPEQALCSCCHSQRHSHFPAVFTTTDCTLKL